MKTEVQAIFDEYPVGEEVVRVRVGGVIRAAPNDGSGPEYIRLHLYGEGTWIWGSLVSDWNDSVAETDSRWIPELS